MVTVTGWGLDARNNGKLTLGRFSNQGLAEGPPETQTVQVEVAEESVPDAQQEKFRGNTMGKANISRKSEV